MAPDATALITWIGYDPDGTTTGGRLRAAGMDLRLAPKAGARTPEQLLELLDGAVAAIVSTDPFDESVLGSVPALRVVARVGVGTDSIDLAAATEAGVVVTVTRGANEETAADHALALMLALLRRLVEHDVSVRRGEWRRGGEWTGWDLHGTTAGVVGYGAIGRSVARRLTGFDVDVLVADPGLRSLPADGPGRLVTLEELLRSADVVSLHLPLDAGTRGLIDAEALALLRPEAVLVNTSRGGVVDEVALAHALRHGHLRGAGLDVFTDEPAVPAALLGLPNVVLTPHVGGLSERSVERMTALATDSVLQVLHGSIDPGTVANPEVLTAVGAG